MITSGTLRKATVVLVALAASSIGAGSGVASIGSEPAPRDRVYPRDLPTTGQVADIYPYFKGGSRSVNRNRNIDVRDADCMSYVTGPRAASGRWSFYVMSDGELAYFVGKADPGVFVYKFSTLLDAKQAIRAVVKSIRDCEGTHVDGIEKIVSREIDIPALGDRSIAFRETEVGFRADPSDADYLLRTWVRRGRYLINVNAQKDPGPPAKGQVFDLLRVALRTAG